VSRVGVSTCAISMSGISPAMGTSVPTLNYPKITHAASSLSSTARARLIFSRIAAPSAFHL
jgi:hypothetical protein